MTIDEQMEILLRGVLFADEVEGGAADSSYSTERADGSPERPNSLRAQMTAELRERLKEGRPLRVYLGADPTRPSLHIGHFVPVQKLRVFQELGHQVIFLIGDYTGLIGDPTGQTSERKRFSHEELLRMSEDYQRQVFRLLDPNKTEVRYNGEWLSKLTFLDLIELAAIFPLKWVVSRRDFADRLSRGESLRLHETLYCLMQGYDAYALDCDVQVGGYDQYFNLLAGRWIQERFGKRPHVAWTYPLLMGTDGRKMSKSFGNSIDILDTAEDMYGKCMRISDDLIESYIDLTTDFSPERSGALKARLRERGVNPMDVKKEVAANLVSQYHGAGASTAAADHFRAVVQEKSVPDEIEEVRVPEALGGPAVPWVELLVALKLSPSKSEVRRLMGQGGFYVEQEAVRDPAAHWSRGTTALIRLGKRRYYRVIG